MDIKGTVLHSAAVASASQSATRQVKISDEGNGIGLVHIRIAAAGANTLSVKLQGRAASNLNWVDLKKNDYSTAATVAQAGGALTEAIIPVTLMPEMRADFSGTITGSPVVDVVLVGRTGASRANS